MGVGRITGAREVTQGAVHAAHDGAGEAAHRIAAIGAHAGREAQAIGAHGQREALTNGEEMLKTMRDLAVKALWEKPIAEAEEKLKELDLECRSKGWRDENGVERPGFDLVRGAEAAQIGEQWDAYMTRKSKEIFDRMGLTAGQREELAKRTAKFRAETRARLTERGAVEAITSNLADIDAIAVKSGERNVMDAVERANEAAGYAEKSVGVTGNAEAGAFLKTQLDDAAAVSLSDALVAKRDKLIRDKVIGGLGRKSEAVATAEADKIVRAEALETVKALAAAGHYDRARKLVEQGKKLGYDDAALAKGRELVDGAEVNAAVNEANVAISTIRDADGNYPAGRVETIERSIATVRRVGKAQPKGSKLAADAAAAVAQMDRHAELIRYAEMANDPAAVGLDAADVATAKNPFKKGTRDARCWEEVRKSALKGTAKPNAARAAFMKDVEANMRHYAAGEKGLSPAKFYADAAAAMKGGLITNADRLALVDKFEKGWGNGYLGDANRQSALLRKAQAVSAVLKEEFGDAIESELQRDKDGIVKLTKDGGFAYDPKAEPSGLTVTRQIEGKPSTRIIAPGWASHTPAKRTASVVLTPDEKLMIANKALELAKYDGLELGFDPVTGIPMEEGKTHKVSVANDMRRLCGLLKSSKAAEGVRDAALERLRGRRPTFGQALEGVGVAEMAASPLGPLGPLGLAAETYGTQAEADREEAGKAAKIFRRPADAFSEFFMRVEEKGKALRD